MTDKVSEWQWLTDWGFILKVKSDRMTGQIPPVILPIIEKKKSESLDTLREF